MPEKFTQAERLIAVDTPLGADKLLLRSFSGAEGISKLFHFQLDMLVRGFEHQLRQDRRAEGHRQRQAGRPARANATSTGT